MEEWTQYMTLTETRAEEAYIIAYRAEYNRCYDPAKSGCNLHLTLWQRIAHTAGLVARERVLQAEKPTEIEQPAQPVVSRIIDGKRYTTEGAIHLWTSSSGVRLFRTERGAYFRIDPQQDGGWSLSALDQGQALFLYQIGGVGSQRPTPFEQAFPGLEIENA